MGSGSGQADSGAPTIQQNLAEGVQLRPLREDHLLEGIEHPAPHEIPVGFPPGQDEIFSGWVGTAFAGDHAGIDRPGFMVPSGVEQGQPQWRHTLQRCNPFPSPPDPCRAAMQAERKFIFLTGIY